jgi:PAS domain-containing protein
MLAEVPMARKPSPDKPKSKKAAPGASASRRRTSAPDGGSGGEGLLQQYLEKSPDSVYVHVGDVIVFANDAAARAFGGRSPLDLIGRQASAFYHPESRALLAHHRRKRHDRRSRGRRGRR